MIEPYLVGMEDSQINGRGNVRRARIDSPGSRNSNNCVFVDRDEFCRLLTSRRSLKRADDIAKQLACLVDHTSGRRYAIERDRLFRIG